MMICVFVCFWLVDAGGIVLQLHSQCHHNLRMPAHSHLIHSNNKQPCLLFHSTALVQRPHNKEQPATNFSSRMQQASNW